VICVNDAYTLAPFADVVHFADSKWWHWHKNKPAFKNFLGQKSTMFVTGMMVEDPAVHIMRIDSFDGISVNQSALCTGGNSGHQAINIGILAGAKRVLLLGYDAKPSRDNRAHFFGDHPDKTSAPYANMVSSLRRAMPQIKSLGVELINCTPDSALTFLPNVPISEALCV
jgi:hypothetical protein